MREHDPSRRTILRRGAAALAATTALAGCAGGDAATETGNFDGEVVEVGPDGRNVFSPGTNDPLRVDAGTSVRWVWRSANHNIAVRGQPADANWGGEPDIHHTDHTHEHTFEVPGEYHYVCEPHEGMGMVADLVVE
ncbi:MULTISPECIES: plastocyanin/azurin family copper-binding protein [Halolamina]|uniref:Plastocyanin n=1 Tax=Halolamina pelagica TaxID=699431 RepID=A0A1I5SZE2_9EURY|nr:MULTISPECIES: plastocyanin/azurin family copper-binding protein [Halolamina]NHX36933.1 plasmid stabilization protein [Halolamina sp. R1-12]SFP76129.1 Plastocyanin [Halolamina pelagica]